MRRGFQLAFLCLGLYPRGAVGQSPAVQGTYQLFVCRGGCGARAAARAYVQATVVLLDRPLIPRDSAADSDPTWSPNGCFYVRRHRERSDSYAGIAPRDVLTWHSDSVSIWFDLYRSPDAGYRVVLAPTPRGYSGRGDSWGDGAADSSCRCATSARPARAMAWSRRLPASAAYSMARRSYPSASSY